jgi:hypothetical protein
LSTLSLACGRERADFRPFAPTAAPSLLPRAHKGQRGQLALGGTVVLTICVSLSDRPPDSIGVCPAAPRTISISTVLSARSYPPLADRTHFESYSMQHESNLIPFPAARRLAAADYAVRCRGVHLHAVHRSGGELAALVSLIKALPDALVEELEFVQAHAPNDYLVCIRDWRWAQPIGKAIARAVAEHFSCSFVHVVIEGDPERKSIAVESDGNRSWVVH